VNLVTELVYLSLGSNLGERPANLRKAIERLHEAGIVRAVSGFYETEPVELLDQPWFLNCAVALETSRSPVVLLETVLAIEHEMGRLRAQDKGPRLIDIDILLFGDRVVEQRGLRIPHPAMPQRRFVLAPLAEIAPEAIHPGLKRTVGELLAALPAGQIVRRLETEAQSSKP
jgi:2-amino-4-hydroxy-6-hydroxymethyldihydropteridine diphosphokinase